MKKIEVIPTIFEEKLYLVNLSDANQRIIIDVSDEDFEVIQSLLNGESIQDIAPYDIYLRTLVRLKTRIVRIYLDKSVKGIPRCYMQIKQDREDSEDIYTSLSFAIMISIAKYISFYIKEDVLKEFSGKVLSGTKKSSLEISHRFKSIEQLKEDLAKAIDKEDYEEADKISKEINIKENERFP